MWGRRHHPGPQGLYGTAGVGYPASSEHSEHQEGVGFGVPFPQTLMQMWGPSSPTMCPCPHMLLGDPLPRIPCRWPLASGGNQGTQSSPSYTGAVGKMSGGFRPLSHVSPCW